MSESARELARKLLNDTVGEGVSRAPSTPPSVTRRPRRGPGRQFADHPEVAAMAKKRATIAELYDRFDMPNPVFLLRESANDTVIRWQGRELVNFGAYNYLGLSNHPKVVQAAKDALDTYGASASASRIVAGEIPLYAELEQRLAGMYDVADALVTTSGYLTNAGVIGFLLRDGDVAICDSLIHRSVVSGVQWSGARQLTFRHNDPESLRSVLRMARADFDRALVVIEGHYSMDGTIGKLPEIAAIAREFDCAVMVDEAHSLGVFGANGRGVREHFGLPGDAVDIWMGTLSKALGSCGGFVAGDADLIGAMKVAAPGVAMLSGGPAPSTIGAALAALDILDMEPQRLTRLWSNTEFFRSLLVERDLDLGVSEGTPIFPVMVPQEFRAGFVSARLLQQGIYTGAITAPAVPVGAERLRFFLTSEHTPDQLRSTADELAEAVRVAEALPAVNGIG
ncbi:aminotransferase class I/II-fold pyridoxal phosphate-dependent enzyme [Nocardia ignorata]|uniref:8-amino-7-oxononanoate synthase n=1 Tax=Nocardia ignorata TaxID=145285 RepID=A0A4R6PP41_NOCIG|nr:aminotransferase class I/II-fold pyridoxal phosphate-dependent enzyme [Nocardia ignorata]TDP39663.1 7-keto-8-aminopelargonate synthetase-like enzyme [Nocardia ignorata]